MVKIETISLINDFFSYWEIIKDYSINEKIESYPEIYLKDNKDLFEYQKKIYESEGENWKKIAKEHIFPDLENKITHFEKINTTIKKVVSNIIPNLDPLFPSEYKMDCIVYFGLGVGAGHATIFRNNPSLHIGVENIVDCNWLDYDSLSGLLVHEIGHLYHFYLRKEDKILPFDQPNHISKFWQLYEEGFAMYMEEQILQKQSFHISGTNNNWFKWCTENKANLSRLFLEYIKENKNLTEFFGSWLNIKGYIQTGYYLGYELIKELRKKLSIEEIALFSDRDLDEKVPNILKNF